MPKGLTVDTNSFVRNVAESTTGPTAPETVNTKILDSPRIDAWGPAVIPTGQFLHPRARFESLIPHEQPQGIQFGGTNESPSFVSGRVPIMVR